MQYQVPSLPPNLNVQGEMTSRQFKAWDKKYASHTDLLLRLFANTDMSFITVDGVVMEDKRITIDIGYRFYLYHENGRLVSEHDLEPIVYTKKGIDKNESFFLIDRPKKGIEEILRMYRAIVKSYKVAKLPVPKMKIICEDEHKKILWSCNPADIL